MCEVAVTLPCVFEVSVSGREGIIACMDGTNDRGVIAEVAIAAEAVKLGIGVSRPFAQERYDLIFDMRPGLLRVQCKCARPRGDILNVPIGGSWHSPGRGYVRSTYTEEEIDAIAIYCPELDRSYLVPIALTAGIGQLHLRLAPTRNRQKAAINWASDYEFGAIAQLGERVAGSDEVVGSSPTGSTTYRLGPPGPTAKLAGPAKRTEPIKHTVGMDEFYTHLAHYVRAAEAGISTLVTRWGRPVAVVGPCENPSVPAGDR